MEPNIREYRMLWSIVVTNEMVALHILINQ